MSAAATPATTDAPALDRFVAFVALTSAAA
jgi:hypothetical protein